ncbi:Sodium channel protein 60E [Diplonema papillatum]|nr:Sodium channel protein 60E [Diplonema papillatum]
MSDNRSPLLWRQWGDTAGSEWDDPLTEQGKAASNTGSLASAFYGPAGRRRYERNRAFFCVYPDGWFRGVCIDLVCNVWFDRAILVCIVANTITITLDDPLHEPPGGKTFQYVAEVLDLVFLGVFTLEMVVKLAAMGGALHSHAYFRDMWNVLDCFIVMAGLAGLVFTAGPIFSAFRSIRIFRPLRTISKVRGMKNLIDTLASSVPILLNVLLLSSFVFFVFGLLGVILWSNALHHRCYGWSEVGDAYEYTTVCSDGSEQWFPVGCPDNYTCESGAPNPNARANWDNVMAALFVVTQCLTLDDWITHMYQVQDGWSPFAAIYFVLLTLVSAFFILNLVLAVVTDSFTRFALDEDEGKQRELRRDSFVSGTGLAQSPSPGAGVLSVGLHQGSFTGAYAAPVMLPPSTDAHRHRAPSSTTSSSSAGNRVVVAGDGGGYSSSDSCPHATEDRRNVSARSRTRKNSLYLKGQEPSGKPVQKLLEADQLTKREWTRFTDGLEKSARTAIRNIRRVEGQREWNNHVKELEETAGVPQQERRRRRADTLVVRSGKSGYDYSVNSAGLVTRRRSTGGDSGTSDPRDGLTQARAIEHSSSLRRLNLEERRKLMAFTSSAFGSVTAARPSSAPTSPLTGRGLESGFPGLDASPRAKPAKAGLPPTGQGKNNSGSSCASSPSSRAAVLQHAEALLIPRPGQPSPLLAAAAEQLAAEEPQHGSGSSTFSGEKVSVRSFQSSGVPSDAGGDGKPARAGGKGRKGEEKLKADRPKLTLNGDDEDLFNKTVAMRPTPSTRALASTMNSSQKFTDTAHSLDSYVPLSPPVRNSTGSDLAANPLAHRRPGLAKIPPLLKKAEQPREKPPVHPSTPRGRALTCLSPASGNLATPNELSFATTPTAMTQPVNTSNLTGASPMTTSATLPLSDQNLSPVVAPRFASPTSNASQNPYLGADVEDRDWREYRMVNTRNRWAACSMLQDWARDLSNSAVFTHAMTALIVLNALIMSCEHYHMAPNFLAFLDTANYLFVGVFAFEASLKIYALPFSEWWQDKFNIFDAAIAVVSVIEILFLSSSSAVVFRVFRLARVVRVVKLARRWTILRHIVRTVGSCLMYMGHLLLLLLLFIFVFAILGRQLFAGQVQRCCSEEEARLGLYSCYEGSDEHFIYDPCWNSPPMRANFDTLYASMVAVFQIVTGDYWTATMYKAMDSSGSVSALYFIVVVLFGRYLLMNLFVAILLVGLEREHAMVDKEEEDAERETDAWQDVCYEEESDVDGFDYPPAMRYANKKLQEKIKKQEKTAMRSTQGSPQAPSVIVSPSFAASTGTASPTGANPLVNYGNAADQFADTWNSPVDGLVSTGSFASGTVHGPGHTFNSARRSSVHTANPAMLAAPVYARRMSAPLLNGNGGTPLLTPLPVSRRLSGAGRGQALGSPKVPPLRLGVARIDSANRLLPPGEDADGFDDMIDGPVTARLRRRTSSVNQRLRSRSLFMELNEEKDEHGNPKTLLDDVDDDLMAALSPRRFSTVRTPRGLTRPPSLSRLSVDSPATAEPRTAGQANFDGNHRGSVAGPLTPRGGEPSPRKFSHVLGESPRLGVSQVMEKRRKQQDSKEETPDLDEVLFERDHLALTDWRAVRASRDGGYEEVLLGKSWGLLAPEHPLRVFLWRVVDNSWFPFENTVGGLIFLNCITLCLNAETVDHDETVLSVLEVLDVLFTFLFFIEMMIRITVYTFRDPVAGPSAYLRRGRWNWLDILVVFVSSVVLPIQYTTQTNSGGLWSGFTTFLYKASRAFRAWRPLRIFVRSQNMQIVIGALLGTIPAVFNVFTVASVSYFMFGVASLQLFKGSFMACNDGSNRTLAECDEDTFFAAPPGEPFSSWYNDSFAVNDTYPDGIQMFRRRWVNIYPFNFNNIGHSLLTLFECAILNGWTEVFYAVVDCSTEEDGETKRNNQPALGLLVIVWVFFGGLGIMNVFIGCVVDYFSRLKTRLDQPTFLTKSQMQTVRIKKILASQTAKHKLVPAEGAGRASKFCFKVVSNKFFNGVIVAAIVLHILVMSTIHYEQNAWWTSMQRGTSFFFSAVFSTEMLLKIGVGGVRMYLASAWNKIDCAIVVSSWVEVVVTEFITRGSAGSAVQLLRLGRVIRLIRHFKGLKKLIMTLYYSIPAVLNVGSLLLLIFFIYGVMGMVFFGGIRNENYIPGEPYLNPHWNFNSFPKSVLTLYRISTFDSWRAVLKACLLAPPFCSDSARVVALPEGGVETVEANCGATNGWYTFGISLYFSAFVLTVGFVMFNLFIAVVLENFSETVLLPPPLLAKMELVRLFRESWSRYDPMALQIMKAIHFVPLMNALPSPLGFADCEPHEILPSLLHLDFPVTKDSDILFVDVIDAIGETVFKIKLVDRETTRKQMGGLLATRRDLKKDKERYALGFTIGDWYAACVIQVAWRRWHGPLGSLARRPHLLAGHLMDDVYERSYRRFPFGKPDRRGPRKKQWKAAAAFVRKRAESVVSRASGAGGGSEARRDRAQSLLRIFSTGSKKNLASGSPPLDRLTRRMSSDRRLSLDIANLRSTSALLNTTTHSRQGRQKPNHPLPASNARRRRDTAHTDIDTDTSSSGGDRQKHGARRAKHLLSPGGMIDARKCSSFVSKQVTTPSHSFSSNNTHDDNDDDTCDASPRLIATPVAPEAPARSAVGRARRGEIRVPPVLCLDFSNLAGAAAAAGQPPAGVKAGEADGVSPGRKKRATPGNLPPLRSPSESDLAGRPRPAAAAAGALRKLASPLADASPMQISPLDTRTDTPRSQHNLSASSPACLHQGPADGASPTRAATNHRAKLSKPSATFGNTLSGTLASPNSWGGKRDKPSFKPPGEGGGTFGSCLASPVSDTHSHRKIAFKDGTLEGDSPNDIRFPLGNSSQTSSDGRRDDKNMTFILSETQRSMTKWLRAGNAGPGKRSDPAQPSSQKSPSADTCASETPFSASILPPDDNFTLSPRPAAAAPQRTPTKRGRRAPAEADKQTTSSDELPTAFDAGSISDTLPRSALQWRKAAERPAPAEWPEPPSDVAWPDQPASATAGTEHQPQSSTTTHPSVNQEHGGMGCPQPTPAAPRPLFPQHPRSGRAERAEGASSGFPGFPLVDTCRRGHAGGAGIPPLESVSGLWSPTGASGPPGIGGGSLASPRARRTPGVASPVWPGDATQDPLAGGGSPVLLLHRSNRGWQQQQQQQQQQQARAGETPFFSSVSPSQLPGGNRSTSRAEQSTNSAGRTPAGGAEEGVGRRYPKSQQPSPTRPQALDSLVSGGSPVFQSPRAEQADPAPGAHPLLPRRPGPKAADSPLLRGGFPPFRAGRTSFSAASADAVGTPSTPGSGAAPGGSPNRLAPSFVRPVLSVDALGRGSVASGPASPSGVSAGSPRLLGSEPPKRRVGVHIMPATPVLASPSLASSARSANLAHSFSSKQPGGRTHSAAHPWSPL